MNEEIEKMGKFACMVCEMGILRDGDICCSDWNSPYKCYKCLNFGKSLYDAGYRKVKPVIAKINDNVEVHCDTMEDYDAFLKEILKPEVKTVGDRVRRMSDEEWAELCIPVDDNNPTVYVSPFLDGIFATREEAYQANLEYLKQECKGE